MAIIVEVGAITTCFPEPTVLRMFAPGTRRPNANAPASAFEAQTAA